MRSFRDLSKASTSPSFGKIFGLIADKDRNSYVGDSKAKEIVVSTKDTQDIQALLYEEVKARYVADGIGFETLTEAQNRFGKMADYVKDAFYNPISGTGTGVDPGMWNTVNTPVSMSPNEATSYYAAGGLGRRIIDKKAKGALLNGYRFEADFMPDKDRQVLKDYAQSIGFDEAVKRGCRNALVYGGAMTYPVFKKDTPDCYVYPLNKLVDDKIIEKGCIDRFVQADRWNCVLVPDYNITARDYIYPSTFFIPIGGIRVATARCAMIRSADLPYWAVIRQIGWGVSDFEGYVRSILAYKIIIASVPIMAQQMSLLFHEMPIDGILAQNGKDSYDEFIAENNASMRKWSMFNPQTINSFGEVKAINRTFTNYSELIMSLRQDIGANSGFSETELFDTQSKGFSDNTESNNIKQSETIKAVNQELMPAFKPIIKVIIASCFGTDSEYFQKADLVKMSFDSPEVVTNEERGKMLEKFANGVASLKGAGVDLKNAVKISQSFLPDISIPDEYIEKLSEKEPKQDKPKDNPFLAKNGSAPENNAEGESNAESA